MKRFLIILFGLLFMSTPALADKIYMFSMGGPDWSNIPSINIDQLELDQNVEALSGNKTLTTSDKSLQKLDPNGSDRDVTLPAEASSTDLVFWIYNTANGAGEDLVIKNDSPATIVTLGPGMGMMFSCDGTSWVALDNEGILYDAQAATYTFNDTLNLIDGVAAHIIKAVQEPGLGGRLTIGLDETARTIVICDAGDVDTDFGLTANAHPTLRIFTAGASDNIEISTGLISFNGPGDKIIRPSTTSSDMNFQSFRSMFFTQNYDLAAGDPFTFKGSAAGKELTDTNGEQSFVYIEPQINQSGTAAYNGLHINVLEETPGTSMGDGSTGQGNNLLLLERESVPYFRVDRLGVVTFTGYSRHIDINAGTAVVGNTAPTPTTIEFARGLGFDADAELAFFNWEVPDDWDGVSDFIIEVVWFSTDGDAVQDGETVKLDINYYCIAEGEAIDNGTPVEATTTYTASGAQTDKEMFNTVITIDHDHADQTLTKQKTVTMQFNRDTGVDTYTGMAIVLRWEIKYAATGMPYQ